MFIKRTEYDYLRRAERLKGEYELQVCELEKEVKRLSELITSKVDGCNIGAWCKDCIHYGHDKSVIIHNGILGTWESWIGGEVQYCKKHIHDICYEFEMKD